MLKHVLAHKQKTGNFDTSTQISKRLKFGLGEISNVSAPMF